MDNKSRPSTAKPNLKDAIVLDGPGEMAEHCAAKVAFIRGFFGHNVSNDELFTDDSMAGFHFLMEDLQEDLEVISKKLMEWAPVSEIAEQ